jgi:DnaJ domain
MAGDGALAGIFTYVGWAFLPNVSTYDLSTAIWLLCADSRQFLTSILQTVFYNLTTRAGSARPQPGQPLYAYHRRRIHIFVLSLYLLYTLVQTLYDIRLAQDFYTILAVSPTSPDREIKGKFRRLAARFHPDKVRPGNDGIPSPDAEAAFVQLKLAHDTLLDPAKRFAYDRFGPGVVRVQQPDLKTIRDYVYAGFRSVAPEYARGALMLVVLNYFWLPKWGQFWRYLAILSLAFLEMYFLTHEWKPPAFSFPVASIAHWMMPAVIPQHMLPFQILALARRMSISLNIFISQLAPLAAGGITDQDPQIQAQVLHMNQLAGRADAEATGLLGLGFAPFQGEKERIEELKKGMKEGMVTSAIRSSPEVREAVAKVLARREEQIKDHSGRNVEGAI